MVDRLLALHPHLATVPADAPDGMDSRLPPPPPIDWTKAGNVFPVDGEPEEGGETGVQDDPQSDEDQGDEQREEATWEDWALCLGAEIMAELRAEVYKKLHYTCSAVSRILLLRHTICTTDNRA